MKNKILLKITLLSSFLSPGAQAYNPFRHVGAGLRDLGDEQNLITLGVGSALTFVALGIDQSLARHYEDHNPWGGISKLGNDYLGTGIPGAVVGLSTLLYGAMAKKDHEIHSGQAHLEALAMSGLLTGLLKFSFRRDRPDGGHASSFPSGHTSTTFTSAMVLHEMYDSVWLDIVTFSLASYTGACRVTARRHYLSDVLFGATLGVIVGHAFAKHHKEGAQAQDSAVAWMPYFDSRESFGIMASKSF